MRGKNRSLALSFEDLQKKAGNKSQQRFGGNVTQPWLQTNEEGLQGFWRNTNVLDWFVLYLAERANDDFLKGQFFLHKVHFEVYLDSVERDSGSVFGVDVKGKW